MSTSAAPVQVRAITDDELHPWVRLATRAFHDARRVTEADLDLRRQRFAGQRVSAAFAGDAVVGTFRSYGVDLPVPGGSVAADAVSSVTVAGTHRRRGVLTTMMGADLAAAAERGDVLAVLIASEAPIYGRFGYGPATEACDWTLDSAAARFPTDPVAAGEVVLELAEDADLRQAAPAVYAAAAAEQPGAMPRHDLWWDMTLGLQHAPGEDAGRARPAVLARDPDGRPVGVLRYRVQESYVNRRPRSAVEVLELSATTPAAHAALWRFLADIDLTATVRAHLWPVHDPLPWLLADRRAAEQVGRADFQWVRLLDVPAALRARRYATAGSVVVEVVDDAGLPGCSAGCRVRLDVDPSGRADVDGTTAAPDVVLDVAALGSAYLGQVPLAPLQAAGLVRERTPGAVARLGALLSWAPTAAVGHTWF